MKLYQFAEKICLYDLADYAITTMISTYCHHRKHPSPFSIKLTYQVTAPGSPLRTFMAEHLHYRNMKGKSYDLVTLCETFIGCEDLISDFVGLLKSQKLSGKKPKDRPVDERDLNVAHARGWRSVSIQEKGSIIRGHSDARPWRANRYEKLPLPHIVEHYLT
jgi:hypothetical protein